MLSLTFPITRHQYAHIEIFHSRHCKLSSHIVKYSDFVEFALNSRTSCCAPKNWKNLYKRIFIADAWCRNWICNWHTLGCSLLYTDWLKTDCIPSYLSTRCTIIGTYHQMASNISTKFGMFERHVLSCQLITFGHSKNHRDPFVLAKLTFTTSRFLGNFQCGISRYKTWLMVQTTNALASKITDWWFTMKINACYKSSMRSI